MDILQEIVAYKRQEVREMQQYLPLRQLEALAQQTVEAQPQVPSLRQAVEQAPGAAIIAEFKRRSPSKGWISQASRPEEVVPAYQAAGAAGVSILTDSHYFGGYPEHVQQARAAGVTLPVLFKNFVIDPYQVLQARHCGASAILLIAACLTQQECASLMDMAHAWGLEVLLEMHAPHEVEYAALEPDLCGVNNRALGTFHTDVQQSLHLASLLPPSSVRVSESGLADAETIARLQSVGYKGFLMGEHFMRQPQPGEALRQLLAQLPSQASNSTKI